MRISSWKSLVAVSMCLATAACTGSTASSSSDDGDPKSLTYLIEEPEDAEALDALERHFAEFTDESGIEVDVKTLPADTMRTVIQTQLRSGEGPDLFSWGSGPGFGGALADAGLLYDLTDAYEERDWQVFDFAKDRVTSDGKVWGIPGELETIGLYYNKKIFADLGIAPPQSLDDLRDAADEIRDAGILPMAVGDKEGWEGGHLLSMALASEIGSDGVEALLDGSASWDSPEVVSALELWRDFAEAGYLPESPTSVDYDGSAAQFYAGEAAMIPTGSWLVGEIDDNVDGFDVGYIPFPASDGPGIFTGGLGSGPYVSASTSKTDAALQFLDFLASPEHGRWTVENLHSIPPMPLDAKGLEVSPLFAKVIADTAEVTESGDFGYNIDVMTSDAFNKAMYDGVQGLFTGQSTPEEVASSLEAAARK
jgi:raffinose/stachyose/melibiose transport system substrate-binding protein